MSHADHIQLQGVLMAVMNLIHVTLHIEEHYMGNMDELT